VEYSQTAPYAANKTEVSSREFTAKLRAKKTRCFLIGAVLGLDSIEDLPTESFSERGPALDLRLMGVMVLGASTALLTFNFIAPCAQFRAVLYGRALVVSEANHQPGRSRSFGSRLWPPKMTLIAALPRCVALPLVLNTTHGEQRQWDRMGRMSIWYRGKPVWDHLRGRKV
jgi:hypothetical protein